MVAFEPQQVDAFRALIFGFAVAGLVFSAWEYLTDKPPSFRMLEQGGWNAALSVPLVVITAPFIILRNTVRGRRFERRSIIFVWLATVIACLWGMAAGRVLLNILNGFLA
ncbi:MAG: hypothetical protein IOC90_13390 [Methylocystis sp.]|nr:hypothetical protein [Methylocystis sp.]MCA3586135.1 hypothetical protein [Methylocystis sp.]MCA3589006.1 hypothetical protein [Methylocystis sp.]MCA3592723.1 hypothetical protein [Methylocystis sp.]